MNLLINKMGDSNFFILNSLYRKVKISVNNNDICSTFGTTKRGTCKHI